MKAIEVMEVDWCKWIRWIAAGLGGVITWVCGPLDSMLEALLIMMALDYATGLICGAVQRRLDSQTGFRGIARKVYILALVGVGSLVDRAAPGLHGMVRSAVCAFYIANEGLSILENAGKIGLPLPKVLERTLSQLKKQDEKEQEEK